MRLRWTTRADRELLDLVSYIYPHNRQAALRLYGITRQRVLQLIRFPKSGRTGKVEGTRELVIRGTSFIAVYVLHDGIVWIAHVIHTSQPWPPEE